MTTDEFVNRLMALIDEYRHDESAAPRRLRADLQAEITALVLLAKAPWLVASTMREHQQESSDAKES
jgi:hypothetical protein